MDLADRIRLPALNLIHRRPRLLNMLAEFIETRQRLITVYAPSGYGKSIMLADFAQTTDLPVCWCSLIPADRDPASFLTLLAYSITDRFRELDPDPLLRLVGRGDTQVSVRRIAEVLATVGPHIIIIDDYHKAISASLTLALNKLLEQLPATSTIIVAARGDMTLATSQIIDLLIAERASGLSEEELRFTAAEIQRVMRKRFGQQIDLESATQIAQATDGNIAQILLTGHMQGSYASQMILSLRERLGDDREIIYNYLAEEVFEKQPLHLQRFMLHTALLPDMTAQVCNELLEMAEAQSYLEELVRKDLFITQIGAGFKYHDLFAEFLRAKLAENEADYRQVALRAAYLLGNQSRSEEAMNLYLSIQAWDEAAILLETKGRSFYDTGRALTLHHWLEQMSEEELARRPRLLLLYGQILNDDLGNPKQAMAFFQRAEEQFLKQDNLIDAADALIWQSIGLRMMGRAKAALALAEKGLEQFKRLKADDQAMAYAIRNRGLAYWTAGNIAEALSDLRQALELYEALEDSYRVGMCHHEIGICLEKQGNLSSAEHHYRQALRIWEALGNANDLANTLNSLGVCFYLKGNYDTALEYFNDSLEIAHQIGATRRAAFALAGIGDAYLGLQAYGQAAEAYVSSTKFAQEAGVQSLEVYNLVKQGECFYGQSDTTRTLKLANRAREIAAEIGLNFELGLACALQAKVYAHRAEYEASFELFETALVRLAQNDVLAQVKVRLWSAYGLLRDLRAGAAFEQLQEAVKSALTLGELLPGLGPTVAETQPLLFHFLHQPDTPTGLRNSIRLLLAQSQTEPESATPGLHVLAFGSPVLIIAGQPKQFNQRGGIRRTPEFLLYLILKGQGRGCPWSEICATLWPDEETEKASVLFHQHLKRLRNTILGSADYVILQDDYYQVDPRYLIWCDALAFEKLFEQANQKPPEEALALQLELIELYRGEFLAGFELEEWGMAQRTSYEARFLQTVKLASEQLLKSGAPREALSIINKGLAHDYFREELHRTAFRAYAKLGLYDDLARHYAELREIFEREFGFSPDPETEQFYEHLVAVREFEV